MVIRQSPNFVKKSSRLTKKNPVLETKIRSKLQLLAFDQRHNSLRLHKIKSKQVDMWSISIDMSMRIIFVYMEYGILLIDIGSHDKVY